MEMKELEVIEATQLLDKEFTGGEPIIEGVLNTGLCLLAGDPKIGKSFLMMQLAYHVTKGINLWNNKVTKGTVLYLALEDSYPRLQQRLNRMYGVEDVPGLFFSTRAATLNLGFGLQLGNFFTVHEDTKLIIIDTLQKIKDGGNESYSYANDYEIMGRLKNIADTCKIAILLVHHTRKMQSPGNCYDRISGTNGLMGAADTTWILSKKKRNSNDATLNIVGRDQPDTEIKLRRDSIKCTWQAVETEGQLLGELTEPIIPVVVDIIANSPNHEWQGTATELMQKLPKELIATFRTNTLSRKLNVLREDFLRKEDIFIKIDRNINGRFISIKKIIKKGEIKKDAS